MDRKECPFCASPDSRIESWVVTIARDTHMEFAVLCKNCGALGPNDLGESGAVEGWNMRRETYPPARHNNVNRIMVLARV